MSASLAERVTALVLALAVVGLAAWALAISARVSTCPLEEGPLSCVALVRPALRSLGPAPIAPLVALGAAAEALAALLLLARGAKLPFARDVAILAALGAGFAVGLQPLSALVARRACLVCLLALVAQLTLAVTFAAVAGRAGARRGAIVAAFLLALVATLAVTTAQGLAQSRADESALATLARMERADARLVLVERGGCPYCEALLLDVLARPENLARVAKTGLARRPAERGEPAPMLLARGRDGRELVRHVGFVEEPEAYEAVLTAAEQ